MPAETWTELAAPAIVVVRDHALLRRQHLALRLGELEGRRGVRALAWLGRPRHPWSALPEIYPGGSVTAPGERHARDLAALVRHLYASGGRARIGSSGGFSAGGWLVTEAWLLAFGVDELPAWDSAPRASRRGAMGRPVLPRYRVRCEGGDVEPTLDDQERGRAAAVDEARAVARKLRIGHRAVVVDDAGRPVAAWERLDGMHNNGGPRIRPVPLAKLQGG
jgi:hypothetical protein